jgi:hypothetical protein
MGRSCGSWPISVTRMKVGCESLRGSSSRPARISQLRLRPPSSIDLRGSSHRVEMTFAADLCDEIQGRQGCGRIRTCCSGHPSVLQAALCFDARVPFGLHSFDAGGSSPDSCIGVSNIAAACRATKRHILSNTWENRWAWRHVASSWGEGAARFIALLLYNCAVGPVAQRLVQGTHHTGAFAK